MIGYRLRLHIDGYSECYDFWVNADSPDIRPAGWCESAGRKLHPPKGMRGSQAVISGEHISHVSTWQMASCQKSTCATWI